MIHPNTEVRFISKEVGWGVVVTEFIPRGTVLWAQDRLDQTFTPEQWNAFPEAYRPILEKYSYLDGTGVYVLCWDHARLVNHSCEPAMLASGWNDFGVAVRDLQPGDAVTDDYGTLNMDEDFECRCGSRRCRKEIRAKDFESLADGWDEIVRPAVRAIPTVEQALAPFWQSREEVLRAIASKDPIPSIRANRVR